MFVFVIGTDSPKMCFLVHLEFFTNELKIKSGIIIQSPAGTLPNQIWLHPTNVKCLKGLSTPTRRSFEQASAVCSVNMSLKMDLLENSSLFSVSQLKLGWLSVFVASLVNLDWCMCCMWVSTLMNGCLYSERQRHTLILQWWKRKIKMFCW